MKFLKFRINFSSESENIQSNSKIFFIIGLTAILIMAASAIGIFFAVVKGSEEVLVPDVTGKYLPEALLEMQVRELYPKIQLRYSETTGDEGKVLEQKPAAGSIVKAARYINLVVSRGVVVDQVGDYTGLKLTELENKLNALFSGTSQPLIQIGQQMLKADATEPGTILSQTPLPGTLISQPIKLDLVISQGSVHEKTKIPNLTELSVSEVLTEISRSKLIFDFVGKPATEEELQAGKGGTVISVEKTADFLPNYSRVPVTIALPSQPIHDNIYGIFTTELPHYPYPLEIQLKAISPEGEQYIVANFHHTGGNLTIPYALPENTQLQLIVEGRSTTKSIVTLPTTTE